MANVLQKEQIAFPSRIRAATLGAALTVLVLAGGLIVSFMISSATFQALSGRVPGTLTFTLALLVFSASTLFSSALWGVGMAHLAQIPVSRRMAWAGILGFVPTSLRQEQLAVIKAVKPPFALVAGGRPSQAMELERRSRGENEKSDAHDDPCKRRSSIE